MVSKTKSYHYIDIYGKELIVSKTKTGNISFILSHDEIVEGSTRKEFEHISLNISRDSSSVYNFFKEMYKFAGDRIIASENPIRDGRNFMILEKEDEEYNIFVRHDLANELRNPFETKIEVSNRYLHDLYEENLENPKVLTKRLNN